MSRQAKKGVEPLKHTKTFHIAVILTSGILAYCNALHAGFLGLDDVGLIKGLISSEFSVKRLFFSGAMDYYRPLPFISYAFDAYFAGLNPVWYHAVNVAIHLSNGLLIYLLALEVLRHEEQKETYALLAALIFVLHPLNTEAVMWISSRPELLCCFFSLLSLILLLQTRNPPRIFSLCCIFIAYLCALFSKEVAIVMLVVIPLYLLSGKKRWEAVTSSAPFFAAALLYLFMRSSKKVVIDSGIGKVLASVASNSREQISYHDAIAAYGFYLKKLIYPFPLNFAITSFDKTSAFLVLSLSVIIAAALFYRYRLSRLPLLIISVAIVPPVLAFFAKLPWTPFAERYLYLPVAGLSLLFSVLFISYRKIPHIVPVSLALMLAIPTINRANLWTDPLAFWDDVVAKSPHFSRAYACRAAALIDSHDYDKAERDLKQANSMGYNGVSLWGNFSRVYEEKHDRRNYEAAMLKLASISPDPTGVYTQLIMGTMKMCKNEAERKECYAKTIEYNLIALDKDPSYKLAYYNVGKLYWRLGEDKKAIYYLKLFTDKARSNPMRPYALKILKKIDPENELEGEMNPLKKPPKNL